MQGKWIVVGMLHSLVIDGRYPPSIRKNFGLILFDEVHRLGADTFVRVCEMFPALLRMGLSATPDRSDGKEAGFQAHIGPILVKTEHMPLKFKVLRYYTDWQCPRRREKVGRKIVTVRIRHTAGKVGHILPSICNHDRTNKKMVSWIKKSYDKGRFIIFFSDRKDHLELIMNMSAAVGVKRKDMSYYVGGMKKDDREKAKGKRILFATPGMMKEGTNIPWFDTMILGSPRSDVKQMVGRILREYPDKNMPVVFDRIDKDSGVFLGYSKSRMEFYKSMDADVKTIL